MTEAGAMIEQQANDERERAGSGEAECAEQSQRFAGRALRWAPQHGEHAIKHERREAESTRVLGEDGSTGERAGRKVTALLAPVAAGAAPKRVGAREKQDRSRLVAHEEQRVAESERAQRIRDGEGVRDALGDIGA